MSRHGTHLRAAICTRRVAKRLQGGTIFNAAPHENIIVVFVRDIDQPDRTHKKRRLIRPTGEACLLLIRKCPRRDAMHSDYSFCIFLKM